MRIFLILVTDSFKIDSSTLQNDLQSLANYEILGPTLSALGEAKETRNEEK